jgi:ubiquinol-cytochrome c reductase cytochrome c1 subunit
MKELKILVIVVFFTLVTYWGVEPYAHSVMHKHVEGEGFTYHDLAKEDEFKDIIAAVKAGKGNKDNGVAAIGICAGCHSIKAAGMPAPMDAVSASATYGVNPPDLSNVASIYDLGYLAAFIKNPAVAAKVAHKFSDSRPHPMYQKAEFMGITDEQIVDIVAYLKSIAKPIAKLSAKEVFENACGRCHAVRYDHRVLGEKWTQIGQKPKFKYEKDSLAFDIKLLEYQDNLKKYMGKLPPDLSIIIRARSENFFESFIENPQTQLPGTAMPSVGVSKAGYEKVMEYLQEVGDPSHKDRAALGPKFLAYLVIFAIFAFLWKRSVWSKLH